MGKKNRKSILAGSSILISGIFVGNKPLICREAKSQADIIGAIRLRVEVFILEQGFSLDDEIDSQEGIARHFVAVADGKVVATARVRKTGPKELRIERMAVSKTFRGSGVGTSLLRFVLGKLKKENPKRIWLSAELQARKFYEKNGFVAVSEPYDECGIPHIAMEYRQNNDE